MFSRGCVWSSERRRIFLSSVRSFGCGRAWTVGGRIRMAVTRTAGQRVCFDATFESDQFHVYIWFGYLCVFVCFFFFFLVLVLSMLCFFLFPFVCLSIYLFSNGDRDWEANYFSRRSAKEESGWQLRERLAHRNALRWRSRAISFTFWFNLFFFFPLW